VAPKGEQPAEVHHEPRQQPAAQRAADPVQAAPEQAAVAGAVEQPAGRELILPLGVVSRSDLSRALREIGVISDFFHQAAIRSTAAPEMPTLSRTLDSLAEANSLNLIHTEDREALKLFLTRLKAKAPVVHLSFPSEASAPFIARILEWFRKEVHPHIVLHIGLQPELAAGCLVRTTNKMYDFSLRKKFEQSKQKLMQSLEALDKAVEHEAVADANATVAPQERLV
jgi:F0F1-type ATP synthase delta subunit